MDRTCRNCWHNVKGKCTKMKDIFKITEQKILLEGSSENENEDLSDKVDFIIADDNFTCKYYK